MNSNIMKAIEKTTSTNCVYTAREIICELCDVSIEKIQYLEQLFLDIVTYSTVQGKVGISDTMWCWIGKNIEKHFFKDFDSHAFYIYFEFTDGPSHCFVVVFQDSQCFLLQSYVGHYSANIKKIKKEEIEDILYNLINSRDQNLLSEIWTRLCDVKEDFSSVDFCDPDDPNWCYVLGFSRSR